MSGNEFMRRIILGETDLSGARIESGFNFNESKVFKEFYHFLKKYNHVRNPLILNDVELHDAYMSNLNIPYLIAENLQISGSRLKKMNFKHGHMPLAKFWDSKIEYSDFSGKTNLYGSNFTGTQSYHVSFEDGNLDRIIGNSDTGFYCCNLTNASLRGIASEQLTMLHSDLKHADVNSTNVIFWDLRDSDMRFLKNVDKAQNLNRAIYSKGTRFDSNIYQRIIELKNKELEDLPVITGKLIQEPEKPDWDKEFERLLSKL